MAIVRPEHLVHGRHDLGNGSNRIQPTSHGAPTGKTREIVIAGDPGLEKTQKMIETSRNRFYPNTVILLRPPGPDGEKISSVAPFTKGMKAVEDTPAVYICENNTCRRPVTDIKELKKELDN